jgi:ElaB/YqjD/DUF883 family membrane-anchored ribosome-binding protein
MRQQRRSRKIFLTDKNNLKPRKQMQKHKNGVQNNLQNIADDTRALLAATADVAEEKVVAARQRLADALDSAKDVYEQVQQKAVEGAKMTDKIIRDHPYQAIGISFGVGALIGFLLSRRN